MVCTVPGRGEIFVTQNTDWRIPAYEILAVINWRITKTVIMYYSGTYIINSFSAIALMDHMHTFSVQAMVRGYHVSVQAMVRGYHVYNL